MKYKQYKQYKVGDKLLCKNGLSYILYYNTHYIVTDIGSSVKYLIDDPDMNIWFIVNKDGVNHSLWFSQIKDYFYTPQEMRQLKLKQLDEI